MTLSDDARFQAFLTLASYAHGMRPRPEDADPVVNWTLWLDPGTHTGLAALLYVNPAQSGVDATTLAQRFQTVFEKIGFPDLPGGGAAGPLGVVLLGVFTEMLYDEETTMVRKAIARVRKLGMIWGGPGWDAFDTGDLVQGKFENVRTCGLGGAGVGAEMFFNLRSERSAEYLSPVRVRSMFQYALDDEFGIDMAGQTSNDALNTFSDTRMQAMGLYVPGPQHPRDALAHALLAVRKSVS
jgi:hypothetical protein